MTKVAVPADASPLPTLLLSPFLSDPTFIAVASGFTVFLLITIYFLRQRSKKDRVKNVLLLGASDSGKTALFTNLVYNQHLASHASLQPNSGIVRLQDKYFRVIDIPGHPRIRGQFVEHLNDVKGVVFTVDANSIARNGVAVAEHIHIFLASLVPLSKPPKLLLLATKSDLLSQAGTLSSNRTVSLAAQARTRVISVLERELEKRRLSNANQKSGGAMEALGAVAWGEKSRLFGGESTNETEEFGVEGVLEASADGVWRFGDEWDTGAVWVGTSSRDEGMRALAVWMDSL